jgi:diadenosine tetraphosphate (Ap4A) HIT family hydrolase
MANLLRVFDCEFCDSPVVDQEPTLRPIANRLVAVCGEILLVADRAPMTLGHLLLIPRGHHTGMASFFTQDHRWRIRALTHRYRAAFGGCTVLEHGASGLASRPGPCIDHAHWHLLPYNYELRPIVDSDYGKSLRPVNLRREFARDYSCADYLLYWDADGARITLLDDAARLPQYARSVVARHLDASAMPYDWDWALRADDTLLAHTLTAARAAFITSDRTHINSAQSDNAAGERA